MPPSEPLYPKVPSGYFKRPDQYDHCPTCGSIKAKIAKCCWECHKHYRPPMEQPDDPSYRYIALTKGKFAIVDTEDYINLMQWKWWANLNKRTGRCYAFRHERVVNKYIHIPMHDVVMGLSPESDIEVDHIDIHATLDNRKSNLRLATKSQNCMNRGIYRNNSSGVTGVMCPDDRPGFRAFIGAGGERVDLGTFSRFEDAVAARLAAEKIYHKEFARKK